MKHHTFQKWMAAGSALLVLLSLTGCGQRSAAQEPVLQITEATQAEAAEAPQAEMPEKENAQTSTETVKTEEKQNETSTGTAVTEENTEDTSTGTPTAEENAEETSTGAPAAEDKQEVPEQTPAVTPVQPTPDKTPTQVPEQTPAQTPDKTPAQSTPQSNPQSTPQSNSQSQPDLDDEPLPDQNPYTPDIDVPDERPTFEGMDFIFADEWAKAQYEDSRYPDLQTSKPNTGNSTLDHWYSLVLEHHELTLVVGETYQMAYSFFGSDELRWYSEDESILTVDQTGRITAHAVGKADIVAVSGECGARQCEITVIQKILTKDEQARAVAQEIANIIMNDPTITTDIERIAYAARFVNAYVELGHTSSIHEDCRTAYGTFVAGYSNCVGSTKATGLVLEYMGFSWRHVNKGQWTHQWCEVYDVDGQTAFCDGSVYGIVGFGDRQEDGSNWLYLTNNGQLLGFHEYYG